MCIWYVLVSQLQLCKPMGCNLPGSSVHGILQARILGWVAIPFSRGSSWPRESSRCRGWTWVSCIAGKCFTVWPPGKLLIMVYNVIETIKLNTYMKVHIQNKNEYVRGRGKKFSLIFNNLKLWYQNLTQ